MTDELAALMTIAGANGVFSADRAAHAGVSPDVIRRLVRTRRLTRLARGWYTFEAVNDPIRRHLLSARALVAAFEGRAIASHQSAVVWHGLPLWRWQPREIHLSRTADPHSRRRTGLVMHGAPAGGWDVPDVVPPAVAVVQYGQQMGLVSGLIAADAMAHRHLGSVDEIVDARRRLARHPGAQRCRQLAELVDPACESPGETRLRMLLRLCGFSYQAQVTVAPGTRVDFLLEDARVIVEFDGRVKYRDADDVFAEKRREDRLRDLGYEVVRIVWADLDHPERIRALIQRAMQRSRARHVSPAGRRS